MIINKSEKENKYTCCCAHANGHMDTQTQRGAKRKEKREEKRREESYMLIKVGEEKLGPYPVESVETVEWLLCVE